MNETAEPNRIPCPGCGVILEMSGLKGEIQCSACQHAFILRAESQESLVEPQLFPLHCPQCNANLSGITPHCHVCGFIFVKRSLPEKRFIDIERLLRFSISLAAIILVSVAWFAYYPVTLRALTFFGGITAVAYALSILESDAKGRWEIIKGAFDPEGNYMSKADLLWLLLGVLMIAGTIYSL